MIDMFGNEVIQDVLLRDKFIEPPFSVLDTRQGNWQQRKKKWLSLGIKSELGRGENLTLTGNVADFDYYRKKDGKKYAKNINTTEWIIKKGLSGGVVKVPGSESENSGTSIFDPALCELIYKWFCPDSGTIIDPFAGGSVRGVVANYLGYKYTGFELRPEQVKHNEQQCIEILKEKEKPVYYIGDTDSTIDLVSDSSFDFAFGCPPYVDLEVYSDLPDDLSTMNYTDFLLKYESIIRKTILKLKSGAFCCFVVGEVRDKKGFYLDFVGDTKRIFMRNGCNFYNDAVLINVVGSAAMRADKQFTSGKKLVKVHQNVLVFKKP